MKKALLIILTIALLLPFGGAATYASPPQPEAPTLVDGVGVDSDQAADGAGVLALFEGRMIDLSQGWGEARVCAVLSQTETRCYRSDAEAEQDLALYEFEAEASQTSPTSNERIEQDVTLATLTTGDSEANLRPDEAVAGSCSSPWLCLYDYKDYNGRKLQFRDRGYWQDLKNWGFRNRTSSLKNRTGHIVYVYDVSPARQGWVASGASLPTLGGGWNNDIDYIYIS